MATRSIVTSVPEVACDVCGRRLLRGERPDVFLAGGERRTVCELCTARAAAVGWLRESDSDSLGVRPPRSRRASSLLGRLRQLREPADAVPHSRNRSSRTSGTIEEDLESELYEFLDESDPQAVQELPSDHAWPSEEELGDEDRVELGTSGGELSTSGELKVAKALEVFNAGEQPRRVAGVSRSLGAPTVTVRPLVDSGGKVVIVVAWELCWYRYEVDLGDALSEPQLLERGMELDELPAEDRLANAAADARGELALLG